MTPPPLVLFVVGQHTGTMVVGIQTGLHHFLQGLPFALLVTAPMTLCPIFLSYSTNLFPPKFLNWLTFVLYHSHVGAAAGLELHRRIFEQNCDLRPLQMGCQLVSIRWDWRSTDGMVLRIVVLLETGRH